MILAIALARDSRYRIRQRISSEYAISGLCPYLGLAVCMGFGKVDCQLRPRERACGAAQDGREKLIFES